MKSYHEYFLLDENSSVDYARSKIPAFRNSKKLSAAEIGDGNLNYIFRVCDENGYSVILKQAGRTLRISSELELPLNRGRQEHEASKVINALIPGMTPEINFYDGDMCVIAMQDMKNYSVMRHEMLKGKTFALFVGRITDYFSGILLTAYPCSNEEKEEKIKKFGNPFLCALTEKLVFTAPYLEKDQTNQVSDLNREFVKENIFDNKVLKSEVEKLKKRFTNFPQALIHGDLHTGSLFINDGDLKIFDLEFSFFGPAGYDIGNVIANLIFPALNRRLCGYSPDDFFIDWAVETICDTVDLFVMKGRKILREISGGEVLRQGDESNVLNEILSDAAGYAGTELIRRTVGMAKVKDITGIENPQKRAAAERTAILIANELIVNRDLYLTGGQYRALLRKTLI